jgi:hypothetical protein
MGPCLDLCIRIKRMARYNAASGLVSDVPKLVPDVEGFIPERTRVASTDNKLIRLWRISPASTRR